MSAVKQVWVAFNGWRRRCWLSRVIILCLLLGFSLYSAQDRKSVV